MKKTRHNRGMKFSLLYSLFYYVYVQKRGPRLDGSLPFIITGLRRKFRPNQEVGRFDHAYRPVTV